MFDLPQVAPYRLARAPLAQAIAQVRYPIQAKLGTLDGVAQVQESLSSRYPYLEPAATTAGLELQFGPEGAQASFGATNSMFVFNSDDGHAIWLAPDSMTLTAGSGSYLGIDDFRERFSEVLRVLRDVVKVPRCDRIAARYLTIAASPPADESAWMRWFRGDFLGWAGGKYLNDGSRVASAVNQVQLVAPSRGALADFPSEVMALVRHGFVPPGSSVNGLPPLQVKDASYVIDLDFFCATPQSWDTDKMSGQFAALHGEIDKFFRWTLTSEGEREFEYEELAP